MLPRKPLVDSSGRTWILDKACDFRPVSEIALEALDAPRAVVRAEAPLTLSDLVDGIDALLGGRS